MMVREDSLRKQIYDLWVKNPYLVAKQICKKLRLSYKKHGNYANKLLSEFRSYYDFGSPQRPLVHRRVFVWRCVPRVYEGVGGMPLFVWRVGWRVVANRNGMWVFRGDRGVVHWYKGGLVRLYLGRGLWQLARVKELFCRAFSWFGPDEFKKYLDVPLREEGKHWVFELGSPLPRFDIRSFERSHGLRIFTDGSHPTALEVEEVTPFWIDRVEQTMTQFGVNIQEHLKLIMLWQKEARSMRKMMKKLLNQRMETK